MVLVVGAAVLNAGGLALVHPDAAVLAVGLNLSVAAVAVAGYVAVATFGRRHAEALVFAVLFVVDAASAAVGAQHPDLGLLAAGYLLMLPMVVALVIPWATWIHVTWLGVHAALVFAASWAAPGDSVLASDRYNLIALLAVAMTVSQFGHVTSLRARVESFTQIQSIRALNRRARRDQVRLDRLNTRLEQSAMTDELTGLKNRLGLNQDLGVVRSRVKRHQQHYGLLMLDLDRFKAINDARGHVEGDRVLRLTADAITKVLRPGDSAYRYGGEEFVVVMLLKEPREALLAAERIRLAVEDLAVPNPVSRPSGRLTISIGVATVSEGSLAEDDDGWVARADAALYRAKAGGRNRCEVDPASITEEPSQAEVAPPRAAAADLGRPSR